MHRYLVYVLLSLMAYALAEPALWAGAGTSRMLVALKGHNQELVHAAQTNNAERVQALLLMPGIAIDAYNYNGFNALLMAAYEGHEAIVRILIDAQADLNTPNSFDRTPLICAAHQRHTPIVRMLIEAGAQVNAQDKRGSTALILAMENRYRDEYIEGEEHPCSVLDTTGQHEIISLLMGAGADVNVSHSYDFYTPLQWVARSGYHDLIRSMINAHADLNAKNARGETALMQATRFNQYDSVKILLESNADVHAMDNKGNTVMAYTEEYDDTSSKLIALLVQYIKKRDNDNEIMVKPAVDNP